MKMKSPLLFVTLLSASILAGCAGANKPVPQLDSITLAGMATEFTVGDTFSLGNLVVTAHFTEGKADEVVTDYVVDSKQVKMDAPAVYPVTVSYTYLEVTKEAKYDVTVNKAPDPTDYTAEEKKLMEDNLEGNVIPFMYVEGYEVVDYMEDWGCVSVEAPNGTVEIAEAYTAVLETLSDFVVTNDEPYDPDLIGYNCAYKVIDDETNALFIVEYYVLEGIWTVDGYIYAEPVTPLVTEILKSDLREAFIDFTSNFYTDSLTPAQADKCWYDSFNAYAAGMNFGTTISVEKLGSYMINYYLPGCESEVDPDDGTVMCYLVDFSTGVCYEVYVYEDEGDTIAEAYIFAHPDVTLIDDLSAAE